MLTSIIVLTLNNMDQTLRCLHSIRTFTDSPYELIFVDNGSTDGTVAWLAQQSDIRLIANPVNVGFAPACNQAAAIANGDHILLLNNDTIVSHRWLSVMLQCLHSSERIGIVGPKSNFVLPLQKIPADVSNEGQYHLFAQQFNRHNPALWQDLAALSGFCMLLRRSTWLALGGFDEAFGIGGYEDIDLGYRVLKAGLFLRLAGDAFVYHEGNRSFDSNAIDMYGVAAVNRRLFIRKWGFNPERLILRHDPAFLPDRYASPHPHHPPLSPDLPSGWYALADDGCVFRMERGLKRPVNSYDTFLRLKLSYDRIARCGNSFLQGLPSGQPLDAMNFPHGYPDVFLARDPGGGLHNVGNGIRYPIRNDSVLSQLGLRLDEAIPVSFEQIWSLPEGWPMQGNAWEEYELYDYLLYRGPNGGLYYGEGQRLRPIVWEQTLGRFGWSMDRAVIIPVELFNRVPIGFPIH
ncbi:glycosyltransferase family 2 protein [Cohnella herbarum]|uniref:Glycosyltransferase family 2 protein n=1 Tax=Cohnella herbarum TaxID=2728023 RepID=A0A7Z2VJC8_9BACL|nr:glycosyltransferase family 2 protein [Cohnella herbarum]QJD84061.1 glycosyltransferase family 2 protein [Cohnella herbarum]